MAAKMLTNRELSAATYGKFGRSGVTVDVRKFLASKDGQQLLKRMHTAATSQLVGTRKKPR